MRLTDTGRFSKKEVRVKRKKGRVNQGVLKMAECLKRCKAEKRRMNNREEKVRGRRRSEVRLRAD